MGPSPHLWFCMQNSDFSIRITSLYGSQHSLVACASKTVTIGPELQVSMGPRPHQWFFAFKTAPLASELLVSLSPSLHLWVCAFKTATLTSELLVSMDASPHLCFLHAKVKLLDVVLFMQNNVISIRITSLYGSQPSSVVLHAKQQL